MATELEIVNLALSRLGDIRLAAYPELTSKPGRAVSAAWPTIRDEVLRAHSWNHATKRDRLVWTQKAITAPGITQAAAAVVTSTAHGFALGAFVRFDAVGGMNQMNGLIGKVTVSNPNDFTVDIDSTAFAAWTSGGTATLVPAFEWGNLYALPADCLRLLAVDNLDDREEWTVEGRTVLTDTDSPIAIRYIYQNLDEATWDTHFVSAAAARLAVALVEELSQSPARKAGLWQEYQLLLAQARRSDGREQTASDFIEDDWNRVRNGSISTRDQWWW